VYKYWQMIKNLFREPKPKELPPVQLPTELREASHKQANTLTKQQGEAHNTKSALEELTKAMRRQFDA
jgi:hypothetical protein